IVNMTTPLYRTSKDKHGDVACGACHGGAHEVWPNRDSKANDNVTAKQLQGHTGTILECNVCHTSDSFKNEADLDGGVYSGDSKLGILGGPHNTHPINDPYWWKSTVGDTANADGTSYGGWHNNYAKKSGKDNEDQCATCHGNDHKGTRLSKTPVDRIFDFSSFNQAKLKKAGFKSKVIKVPAGTVIGCDTCHSIKTSCIGSPAGNQCGIASTTIPVTVNRDPVITSTPSATTAIMGQSYSYKVTATDADGDTLTFGLGRQPGTMSIDPQTGLVTSTWPMSIFSSYHKGPFSFPYTVNVNDGNGGYTTQTINMNLNCPTGQDWVWDSNAGKGECQTASVGATITSQPSTLGLNAGSAYSYQATATDANNLPLTFSLTGQPTGMTITANSGLISWQTDASSSGTYSFKVTATDSSGGYGFQNVNVSVCKAPLTWNSQHGMCM
ncbi:MAG: putative Ig domain-containing protein, partial [Methylococcales bacterium]